MSEEKEYATKEQYEKALTSEDYVKFAQTFNQVETQKLIQESINKAIFQAISCDHETRKSMKNLIKEFEKEELWASLKKFGNIVWTLFALFVGAFGTIVIQYFSK